MQHYKTSYHIRKQWDDLWILWWMDVSWASCVRLPCSSSALGRGSRNCCCCYCFLLWVFWVCYDSVLFLFGDYRNTSQLALSQVSWVDGSGGAEGECLYLVLLQLCCVMLTEPEWACQPITHSSTLSWELLTSNWLLFLLFLQEFRVYFWVERVTSDWVEFRPLYYCCNFTAAKKQRHGWEGIQFKSLFEQFASRTFDWSFTCKYD